MNREKCNKCGKTLIGNDIGKRKCKNCRDEKKAKLNKAFGTTLAVVGTVGTIAAAVLGFDKFKN